MGPCCFILNEWTCKNPAPGRSNRRDLTGVPTSRPCERPGSSIVRCGPRNEANFLESWCAARSGFLPAAVSALEVSRGFGRHRALRADGHQLAEARDLCDGGARG